MPAKRVCVIIPTYNNEKTLLHVIDSVLEYSHHVIVVNDGSTDRQLHYCSNVQSRFVFLLTRVIGGWGRQWLRGFVLLGKWAMIMP